jgi:hypothetical protein
MYRHRASSALLVLVVAACSGGGEASPTTSAATPPGTATATRAPATAAPSEPGPSIALGPAVRLTLDASGPMVASDAGPAGHHWVLPATAARDRDGGFVLFIVWFGDAAGDQIVTVARSDDGKAWRIGKEPILTDLGMDLVHPDAIPAAAVQLDDGTWRLYGWAAHRPSPNTFTSWSAHAPAPEGPWTLDAETALDKGSAQAWDSQLAAAGAVLRDANGYSMWFEGQTPGSTARGEIGLATSADGLAWQKWNDPATTAAPFADSDPVIHRGICGTGTSAAITQPQVERWSGGLAGVVGGTGPDGGRMDAYGVTSVDGLTWVCGAAQPLLRGEDIPGSEGIHTIASVPLEGDTFELIIESLRGDHSELWSATVEVGG